MKSLIALLAAVFVAALFGMTTVARAAEAMPKDTSKSTMEKGGAAATEARTMDGFIIDTKCASGKEARKLEKEGKFDQFVKTHSKECVLECKMGGCEFYSEGRLWKLDKEASKAIDAYLKKPDSTLHIKAELLPAKGDKVMLRNIESVK